MLKKFGNVHPERELDLKESRDYKTKRRGASPKISGRGRPLAWLVEPEQGEKHRGKKENIRARKPNFRRRKGRCPRTRLKTKKQHWDVWWGKKKKVTFPSENRRGWRWDKRERPDTRNNA